MKRGIYFSRFFIYYTNAIKQNRAGKIFSAR